MTGTRSARAGRMLGAIALAGVALPSAALAQSEERFSTDVAANAGYTNNPFTIIGDDTGSALVGVSIAPRYQILTERSTISVTGLASVQQYLRRYGRNDNYTGTIDYQLRPSERVTTHARLDLGSSVLGAFNTFLPGNVGVTPVTPGTIPGTIDPITPLPGFTDVGLFGLRDRRRFVRAGGDVSVNVSARDSITVSGFAEAARYRRLPQLSNYESYGGTLGYSRQVSDHFRAGLQGTVSLFQYGGLIGDTRAYSIQATGSGALNPFWTIDGALGVTFVDGNGIGSTSRNSLSGNVNLCRRGERSTMCVQASRQVTPTGFAGSQYVTSVGLNWSQRISERENLSLSASYSNIDSDRVLLLPGNLPLQNEFAQAVLGYDRQLGQRLRFTASANYRQLFGVNANRPNDFGGQLGLSYRLGDPR